MTYPWQPVEGEVINGQYPLLSSVHADDNIAVFRTEAGPERIPATLELVRIDPATAAAQLSRWEKTAALSHPHILRLLDWGEASDDGSILFVVTEAPDDTLATVLQDRPLSEPEAKEIAESVVGALAYLHERQFVHADVQPASIFAVGERIKLSSGTIAPVEPLITGLPQSQYSAPETLNGRVTSASDIWSFGLTLVSCLTSAPNPDLIATLPQPFREIAAGCLQPDPATRWTASRILAALRGEPQDPVRPAGSGAGRTAPMASGKTLRYAGISAVLVLLGLIGYSLTKSGSQPAPVATTEPVETPAAAPAPAAVVTTPPPSRRAPEEGVRARATAPAPSASEKGSHFVVVATYNRKEDAEKRAKSISTKHKNFRASVYAPRQNHSPYLVVIGENMTKDAAQRLQHKARGSGLPRDTYVQAF